VPSGHQQGRLLPLALLLVRVRVWLGLLLSLWVGLLLLPSLLVRGPVRSVLRLPFLVESRA